MKSYAKKLFNDLIQPLKAAIAGTFGGPTTVATVLLAETLLVFAKYVHAQHYIQCPQGVPDRSDAIRIHATQQKNLLGTICRCSLRAFRDEQNKKTPTRNVYVDTF